MSNANILHLSDLHFGGDWTPGEKAEREGVLRGLIEAVQGLESEWSPSCIAITGDIAWKGSESDFNKAEVWIAKLLEATNLGYEDVIVCAGNHDIDREQSSTYTRPTDPAEADEVLRVPIADHYIKAFKEFNAFCDRNKIPKLKFGEYESNLVGFREHDGIRFLSLNSSWFCKDNDDRNKLWIGLPHLKYLDGVGELPVVADNTDSTPTVCLLHHPKSWLNENEQHSYNSRPNSIDYLAKRCHLLLTGHTHGELRDADRIAESAWHISAGAAYENASHFNSFKMIRVEDGAATRRSFEYDPRSAESLWKEEVSGAKPLPF